MTWDELATIFNKELRNDGTELTKDSYRKPFEIANAWYVDVFSKMIDDGYSKELEIKKRELLKERKKLEAEKLEYNKWLREEARDELIMEKIVNAIATLPPLSIPDVKPVKHNNKAGVLVFGDEHFGVEFELLGLHGEIINAYNEEIFYSRMYDLLNQTVEIVKKENLTKIKVYAMGDFIDGILRVSQLAKLKYGVVDSTIKYADFLCHWLNKLTEYVAVEFQMVFGNHGELRMLSQPKGTFTEDNMGKIVYSMIETRLSENMNFDIVQNPTGLIFDYVCGYKLLGIHGEVKNMEKALKDFSMTYNTEIDYLLAGHLHHSRSETVGVNKEVINVPSIIGVDGYSLSLNKTSNAGATFLIFEENKGKICEQSIKLN